MMRQEPSGPQPGAARRYADEARIAAQLQHPAIPPVHDIGTLPDGRPFLAMKLIKGDTLGELLERRACPTGGRRRRLTAVRPGWHACVRPPPRIPSRIPPRATYL